MQNTLYAVWVGGVADYFEDQALAESCAGDFIAEGYDDVQIEIIEQATINNSH